MPEFITATITATAITWSGGSYLEMRALDSVGCPFQITFQNELVHTSSEHATFVLNSVSVEVSMILGSGISPETIRITPPDGMIAVPSELVVPEQEMGVALICHPMF